MSDEQYKYLAMDADGPAGCAARPHWNSEKGEWEFNSDWAFVYNPPSWVRRGQLWKRQDDDNPSDWPWSGFWWRLVENHSDGMRIEYTKEWCMKRALSEGDDDVDAGSPFIEDHSKDGQPKPTFKPADEPQESYDRGYRDGFVSGVEAEEKKRQHTWITDRRPTNDECFIEKDGTCWVLCWKGRWPDAVRTEDLNDRPWMPLNHVNEYILAPTCETCETCNDGGPCKWYMTDAPYPKGIIYDTLPWCWAVEEYGPNYGMDGCKMNGEEK